MKRVVLFGAYATGCVALWFAAGFGPAVGGGQSWERLNEQQLQTVRGGASECYVMRIYQCDHVLTSQCNATTPPCQKIQENPPVWICRTEKAILKDADFWQEPTLADAGFHWYQQEEDVVCFAEHSCRDDPCDLDSETGTYKCVTGTASQWWTESHYTGLQPNCQVH